LHGAWSCRTPIPNVHEPQTFRGHHEDFTVEEFEVEWERDVMVKRGAVGEEEG
jgi:hypothetical protein